MEATVGLGLETMAKVESLNLNATELSNLIDEWIVGNHAERDREILKARLIHGRSQYQLADQFDLSQTQIKNILRKREKEFFSKVQVK